MESHRYVLIATLFFLGGAGLVFWFQYEDSSKQTVSPDQAETQSTSSKPNPQNTLTNFQLIETVSDTEVWIIEAPDASKRADTIFLTEPIVTYRVLEDTQARIVADEGTYSFNEQRLSLRGNVILDRFDRGQTLRTSLLNWNRLEGTLFTSAPVRLEFPTGTLRADGMWANFRKEQVKFHSSVRFSTASDSGF